jgi:hypothetical protein
MSSAPGYRIDAPGVVLDRIRLLWLRAIRNGVLDRLLTALRELDTCLRTNPGTWGDPLYLYPNLRLLLYQRALGPIYVVYAVDEPRRIAYLRQILPFPLGGLETVA